MNEVMSEDVIRGFDPKLDKLRPRNVGGKKINAAVIERQQKAATSGSQEKTPSSS